ncbi:MAG: hypothetical protein HYR85_00010 [Planctomycetes bacterium]|nr:hypothetical protein [Planctomycetota bacterium]MBI3845943.1 hypothetical protein [Planctomycetota bacterium]
MSKCVYCQERKGKRACPAFDGMICPSCCGTHRLVRIECPSDCVFLSKGETYQEERRFEKSRSHGREYLAERGKKFTNDEEFSFALAFDACLFLAYRSDPGLTDADVVAALAALTNQLGHVVLVEIVPNPLAQHLRNVLEKDSDFEAARTWPDDQKKAIFRTISESVERFAKATPRGRGFFDFIGRYFREVVRETPSNQPSPDDPLEMPRAGGRIILP